jgi:DNA-binding transcriptional MerR regulator/uncharacterized protein (DUF433 family)
MSSFSSQVDHELSVKIRRRNVALPPDHQREAVDSVRSDRDDSVYTDVIRRCGGRSCDVAVISRLDLGHYEAIRAAALAGVPLSTLYHWARDGVVTPSISATREKLWSYRDLLTLRLVRWLRTDKIDVARTTMADVRRMLDQLSDELWAVDQLGRDIPTVKVTRSGQVIRVIGPAETLLGQRVFEGDAFDLFAPFDAGPDLRVPRRHLRIVPGKVAGEPHLAHSRLTSCDVAGLSRRGFTLEEISELYPDEVPQALSEAIDLEASLRAA